MSKLFNCIIFNIRFIFTINRLINFFYDSLKTYHIINLNAKYNKKYNIQIHNLIFHLKIIYIKFNLIL